MGIGQMQNADATKQRERCLTASFCTQVQPDPTADLELHYKRPSTLKSCLQGFQHSLCYRNQAVQDMSAIGASDATAGEQSAAPQAADSVPRAKRACQESGVGDPVLVHPLQSTTDRLAGVSAAGHGIGHRFAEICIKAT